MKFLFHLLFLISLLSLAFALEAETNNEDKVTEAPAALTNDDDGLDLPRNITDPDVDVFDDDDDDDDNGKRIERRGCRGRCRSVTNDCDWRCEFKETGRSRVITRCHEYRPCTRDRRPCSVLQNAPEWATCH